MPTNSEIIKTIDTSGTRCPIPLLRAKQALRQVQVGECIRVLTTDPSAKADFDAMLKHLPHQLVAYERGSHEPGSEEPGSEEPGSEEPGSEEETSKSPPVASFTIRKG